MDGESGGESKTAAVAEARAREEVDKRDERNAGEAWEEAEVEDGRAIGCSRGLTLTVVVDDRLGRRRTTLDEDETRLEVDEGIRTTEGRRPASVEEGAMSPNEPEELEESADDVDCDRWRVAGSPSKLDDREWEDDVEAVRESNADVRREGGSRADGPRR